MCELCAGSGDAWRKQVQGGTVRSFIYTTAYPFNDDSWTLFGSRCEVVVKAKLAGIERALQNSSTAERDAGRDAFENDN